MPSLSSREIQRNATEPLREAGSSVERMDVLNGSAFQRVGLTNDLKGENLIFGGASKRWDDLSRENFEKRLERENGDRAETLLAEAEFPPTTRTALQAILKKVEDPLRGKTRPHLLGLITELNEHLDEIQNHKAVFSKPKERAALDAVQARVESALRAMNISSPDVQLALRQTSVRAPNGAVQEDMGRMLRCVVVAVCGFLGIVTGITAIKQKSGFLAPALYLLPAILAATAGKNGLFTSASAKRLDELRFLNEGPYQNLASQYGINESWEEPVAAIQRKPEPKSLKNFYEKYRKRVALTSEEKEELLQDLGANEKNRLALTRMLDNPEDFAQFTRQIHRAKSPESKEYVLTYVREGASKQKFSRYMNQNLLAKR